MGRHEETGGPTEAVGAASAGHAVRATGRKPSNLNWQIGLLEAECGLKPRIAVCKSIVRHDRKRKRNASQHIAEDAGLPCDAGVADRGQQREKLERLRELKEEKLQRKLVKRDFRKHAKIAKAFEVQRAVKRLKEARKINESASPESLATNEVQICEKELALLKVVDVGNLSDKVFYSGLSKCRDLRDAAVFQQYLVDNVSEKVARLVPSCSDEDVHVAERLEARLVSNKRLRGALSAHLDDLVQHATGLRLAKATSGRKEKGRKIPALSTDGDHPAASNVPRDEPDVDNDDDMENMLSDEDDMSVTDLEALLEKEEAEMEQNGRKRQKKHHGNVGESDDFILEKRETGVEAGMAEWFATRPVCQNGSLEVKEKPKTLPAKKQKAKSRELRAGNSVFVASLDGEDYSTDFNDADFDKIYGGGKPKNRMGQRQRRAIHEAMYGDKAKHKVLERKAREAADAAVAARRAKARGSRPSRSSAGQAAVTKAANAADAKGCSRREDRKPGTSKAQAKSCNSTEANDASNLAHSRSADNYGSDAPKETADKKLHPSWQAAISRRNQISITKTTSGPINQKIIFDD
ncbi:MAG: Bud-site selection protein [Olpidium bornovanus]|uniref:Bud-site selection protein n=1 Tax=Olpidium bornovanus TaxID=278681 RepID=A0A8H8A1V4_9FUNG|nr:MAG: Bud-site selection protein [Olpidium bornovanus]